MDKTLELDDTRIYVVRSIHPYGRTVSNDELASKGLGIGNDWDSNMDHSAYQWRTDEDLGVMMREYNMPTGKWPVYLAKDLEHAKIKFLEDKRNEGNVVYIAEIDLNKVSIGTNLPFEYLEENEKDLKFAETSLHFQKDLQGEIYLVADKNIEALQNGLRYRFDSAGRLKDDGNLHGEFYLDNYKSPSQVENEYIFRVKDGEYVEITSEIKHLRETIESQKERLSSFKLR